MSNLNFTRPDFILASKEGGFFEERDIRWINPREYHRKIISDLENLGFQVPRGVNERLEIKQEAIGSKTGYVISRVEGAKTEQTEGNILFRPFIMEGIASISIGFLIILFVYLEDILSNDIRNLSTIIASFIIIFGILIIMIKKTGKIPLLLTSTISILAEGEATERKYTEKSTEVTDLLAQLTVSIAGSKRISALLEAITDKRVKHALKRKVPNADTPQIITKNPLMKYIPLNISKLFEEDTIALKNTLNTLTQKLENYGHTL